MWGQKPDARSEERLIEDGGMEERRDGERELQPPPSVPWQLFQMLAEMGLNSMSDGLTFVRMEPSRCCLPRSPRNTLVRLSLPLSPSTHLSSHLLSVLYFKGGLKKTNKHRDICIEMFYSELLLMECSEAEMGERARKPLQWHMMGRSWVWLWPHPTLPLPTRCVRKRGRRC